MVIHLNSVKAIHWLDIHHSGAKGLSQGAVLACISHAQLLTATLGQLSSTEHVIESNNGTCFHVHLSLIRPADKSKIKGAIDELLADTEGEDRSARAFCLFDSLDEDREEVARSAAKE